jgi:outer membrane protein, multidrug efflux system
MTRRPFALVALGLAAGCAVGPGYSPPAVAPAVHAVAPPPAPEAPLFDSLAARAAAEEPATALPVFDAQAVDAATWLDVIHDTVLVDLVRTALHDNRDLQEAIARVREYRALVTTSRSPLFPEIDLNGSASTQQAVFGSFGALKYDALRVTSDLQWELDFWGRLRRGLGAARADRDARVEDQRAVGLTLVADVATAYLELLELRENLTVARRTLTTRRTTLDLAQRRYAQGLISELDVRQFEAELAAPAARVAEFTRDLSRKEHQLSILVGRAPGPIPTGSTLDAAVAAVVVPDSVTADVLLRRPDVRRADRELAAATNRIGLALGTRLPRIVVTGQYGSQTPNSKDLFTKGSEVYGVQLGLSMPLFDGGRGKANVEAARARAEQARARYEKIVLTAMGETADALVGVRTNRDQLAALSTQAIALRDALRLAQRRYEGGIASYLEVLDAQRSLFAAELALTSARRQYLVATVQLYKAIGGRWTGTSDATTP